MKATLEIELSEYAKIAFHSEPHNTITKGVVMYQTDLQACIVDLDGIVAACKNNRPDFEHITKFAKDLHISTDEGE